MTGTSLSSSQDMLSVMKNKGPNTEGIFMLPANVTSGQILKEKLDHGQYVNLYMEDVHVVAAVLKEFLQNLENSLMTAELYEEWLSVLDCLTEQEQLAAAKSLLEKVPPVNALLIIHLFRILHTISKNSEKNMMCSDRLALCLAPILLWSPGSGFGEKFARKVSLVSFLIKNSPYIFGEDIIFYETSFFNSYGNKTSSVLQKEIEQENRSHSGMTCPTESDTVPGSTRASLENKEILDSVTSEGRTPTSRPETKEESLNITPPEEDTMVFSPSPPGPFVSPPGHLFGRSLKSICNNGNLPAVILEMISIIHEKGLDEYRLFRYLGTKAFWDLRERIDTQQAVNLNQESVNVIGAVLKDFIGKLQGSLLCCELYEDWLNVLDEGDLDQKISTIQR
ncbi:rho GTPase-activating protein 20-like [Meriones unguiculatus]|uniref:rho GTPase-activating protein 20-like n=1 Tax=Meriones unguiculatus TaxID=10047 RepID=UPI00293EE979|nr:rho GTPase-activating protein 20-like [Meriones unguiculatus]